VFDGVPVRIYRPAGKTGVLPGFVFYHGGGWVVGNIGKCFSSHILKNVCNSNR